MIMFLAGASEGKAPGSILCGNLSFTLAGGCSTANHIVSYHHTVTAVEIAFYRGFMLNRRLSRQIFGLFFTYSTLLNPH